MIKDWDIQERNEEVDEAGTTMMTRDYGTQQSPQLQVLSSVLELKVPFILAIEISKESNHVE